ncbi:unnamed protein product [Caenorhabditis angaria]|uniref:Regulator of microtubule dynamics protein 1 n=1 Tax=Caenorhabditis angaria TaxID=860376 RepID=A0A9P1MV30_9PELO|nr:unnamed protein product [Caenorhabditis angaria]
MQSFENADKLYELQQHQKGFEELHKRLQDGERNAEILWRLCRFCNDIAFCSSGEKKTQAILDGRDYGLQAIEADPTNFEAAKWSAILFGLYVDTLPTKEKISEGGKLKDMLDKALEMDPKDFCLLHLRARFSYTLANLSWFERKGASVLYGELPKATIEDAMNDFEAAYESKPDWIENIFYLSKCYLSKKDKAKAKNYLKQAVNLPTETVNDKEIMNECKKLLEKC